MSREITIIDYGGGNVSSICNAFKCLRAEVNLTSDPADLKNPERLVLPGVGSFGYVMDALNERNLVEPIREAAKNDVPFLGICIGMQVLFAESEESPEGVGLDLIPGKVEKFKAGKIPQLGWNKITPLHGELLTEGYGYFANSFKAVCEDDDDVLAMTNYFGQFPSAVKKYSVMGVQFHPEKSGPWGLEFLRRWARC